MDKKQPILITGAAGFIGFHVSKRLLQEGHQVVGVDSLNDYYDVQLKEGRLKVLAENQNFQFERLNLSNYSKLKELFDTNAFSYVVHLAAQAGVRYSLINPQAYVESNLTSFVNVLEVCRHCSVKHLLYASSSSVYGANSVVPFSVRHNVDHPVSLYAASKKSNELLAHTYSVNFKLPTTGLRFFTVYGPWGRPDMALFLFTKAILNNEPIDVFNHGDMKRDFTYVDDVVEGIYRLLPAIPTADPEWSFDDPKPATSFAPYKIYNIGNSSPVDLMKFVRAIELELNKKAEINYLPIQKGDVPETYADVSELEETINYKPATTIKDGVRNFVKWYREYYNI